MAFIELVIRIKKNKKKKVVWEKEKVAASYSSYLDFLLYNSKKKNRI